MNETERLHGFLVKKFPEKPEFLSMTQEEFEDRTLQAWSGSDEDSRVSAALRGGEREWELLWRDESYKVRGAVACRAGEKYQLRLVGDEVGPVRKRLAVYGTDRVRLALIEHGEADPEVIENIAKFGNTAVRHRLVDAAWGKPQLLTKAVPYLPASDIERLMSHPDTDIRYKAAEHGTREQCLRLLALPCPQNDIFSITAREALAERIDELDAVADAISSGNQKTRENHEMELSP
ncbi:hypothetical protein [Acutalibacter muris]|uniref:hypothetical protein n=1 Tax=Acutalibacter muris TaxID=1796620 RepID=UPI00272E26B1|nr:hypothetical protein [Acutalibacter muris]